MLRKDIKEFLESEGLDISTVVNRLLENFIVAYKAFWSLGAPGLGFEPRSPYGHQLSRLAQYLSATPAFYKLLKNVFKNLVIG